MHRNAFQAPSINHHRWPPIKKVRQLQRSPSLLVEWSVYMCVCVSTDARIEDTFRVMSRDPREPSEMCH